MPFKWSYKGLKGIVTLTKSTIILTKDGIKLLLLLYLLYIILRKPMFAENSRPNLSLDPVKIAIEKIKNLNESKNYKIGNVNIKIGSNDKLKMPSWAIKMHKKGPKIYGVVKNYFDKNDPLIEELKKNSRKADQKIFNLEKDDLIFDFEDD